MFTFASSEVPAPLLKVVYDGEKGVASLKFGIPGMPPMKLIVFGILENSPLPPVRDKFDSIRAELVLSMMFCNLSLCLV